MSAFVYLLRCADGSLYCGWTTDPERRLRQHQAGTASRYTKRRRPVEYALVIPAADRSAALKEEWRIKQLPRREKLALIRGSARDRGRYPGGLDPPLTGSGNKKAPHSGRSRSGNGP